MSREVKIVIALVLVIIVAIICAICFTSNETELSAVQSKNKLLKIYKGKEDVSSSILTQIATLPFSVIRYGSYGSSVIDSSGMMLESAMGIDSATNSSLYPNKTSGSTKDYSTTNVQVENVDEADITKTDGDYIYSISETNVIITDVREPENIKIVSTIPENDNIIPNDMILYQNKLVVISSKMNGSGSYNSNTIVKIYDITNKQKPNLIKQYELYEPYYTSRCIDNKLYVISSGNLRKENDDVIAYYKEDSMQKDIGYDNIKYLKDIKTTKQTLIAVADLNDAKADVNVKSYILDITNAYVSKNSIYLLNQKYDYSYDTPPISSLFGFKGALGAFTYEHDNNTSEVYTDIYKFDIKSDGNIAFNSKTRTDGKTINQYSLDELNGKLRVALYNNQGARVVVFDERLNQIGSSDYVAKGETMYSSRFIGDKAYVVTYKTIDPLFVFDLSNETKPKVLGELKIPGYSTYLHPYDENYLIGIGMETEENVRRDSKGRVISTTVTIVGMKMALFDISDVNNPTTVSSIVIGDRRTTSSILTNPKALLFSKERNLIAIPVNNYSEDFSINSSSDSYSAMVSNYTNYNKSYISEGYLVYDITIDNGFKLKGAITHEKNNKNTIYNYYANSKLLRGLYIDENLYTVSETAVKVNRLDTLELLSELKID